MSGPAPAVSAELKALLRRVKLGKAIDTLPERLALAGTGGMGHAEFLELVLADESPPGDDERHSVSRPAGQCRLRSHSPGRTASVEPVLGSQSHPPDGAFLLR